MESNIEKRKLNFWTRIISSIQGIEHYEEVLKETVGKAILYLLLFSLLLGTVGALRGAIEMNDGISKFIKVYNDQCPNFELKDGELSVQGDMPMVLSEDKDNYVIIDTTNSTSPDVLNSYSKGTLILKDKMIQKKSEVQTQVTDFKSLKGITINKDLVNRYLPIARIVIPLSILGTILWYFLGGLLSALFLAIFALIANAIFKTELKYGQLYGISIYALTTPIIIDVIFKIANINHFSYYWLAYHVIAFVYICFALNKLKNSQNNTEVINNNLI